MDKSAFHYDLPESLIADQPLPNRTESRLMVLNKRSTEHRRFKDLVEFLIPEDLLIINDTKVIKARIEAHKDSGGRASILVERVESANTALCQVRVSKPLITSRTLNVENRKLEILGREGDFYLLKFPQPVYEFLEKFGKVPLPPYIRRPAVESDSDRYQTVYARESGAVAAPTAGLHFDEALLRSLENQGVRCARLTLHVGAGTFQPIRTHSIDDVKMHHERFNIPEATLEAVRTCSGRVVAVGTTVVRTLETWAQTGRTSGETNLFIKPGFRFNSVDAMITNFHLPESTLLMLVSAFAGRERTLNAYQEAVAQDYRFFSYGDAMFIPNRHV